jgi:transcriptional regulator with XRE-family HTH domain
MTFADMLKTAMGGMTQGQLALESGLTQSAISKILRASRNPTITTVWRLEKALPGLRILHDEAFLRISSVSKEPIEPAT